MLTGKDLQIDSKEYLEKITKDKATRFLAWKYNEMIKRTNQFKKENERVKKEYLRFESMTIEDLGEEFDNNSNQHGCPGLPDNF